MTEKLMNWVADTFARSDIIDLYFVVSDLVDVHLSEAEICENAYLDAFATQSVNTSNHQSVDSIPIGKRVY
jgi:hypothetical protein